MYSPAGDGGAFIPIGFSTIAQGHRLLYHVDDGYVSLVDLVSGPIDSGVWSLRSSNRVDLPFPVVWDRTEAAQGGRWHQLAAAGPEPRARPGRALKRWGGMR